MNPAPSKAVWGRKGRCGVKNVKLFIGALAALVLIAGLIFIVKSAGSKKTVKKPDAAVQKAGKGKAQGVPVKRQLSKDMGAFTVKVMNTKGKEVYIRMKVFKVTDAKSSLFVTSMTSNRMQELAPGVYDIEMETVPQRIYKNIRVVGNKEIVEDLGCPTGSIMIKVLNSKKREASYLTRLLYPKSNVMVTAVPTNRPLEVVPGIYDVEIETLPRQVRRDVKIAAGKETVFDLGVAAGNLAVKVLDANDKEVRYTARVRNAANNDIITSFTTNRSVEIQQGLYNIEIASNPPQVKKDVKVNTGEESLVRFELKASAQQKSAAPPQSKK